MTYTVTLINGERRPHLSALQAGRLYRRLYRRKYMMRLVARSPRYTWKVWCRPALHERFRFHGTIRAASKKEALEGLLRHDFDCMRADPLFLVSPDPDEKMRFKPLATLASKREPTARRPA